MAYLKINILNGKSIIENNISITISGINCKIVFPSNIEPLKAFKEYVIGKK